MEDNVRSEEAGLAYFYCDYRDPEKQRPSQLLGTLLATLAKQNRGVFENIQSFFLNEEKLSPMFVAEFDQLLSNFGSFLGQHFKSVYIVVDGLDEAKTGDWDCLAIALKTLSQTCKQVKVLVTSRNEVFFKSQFEDLPSKFITKADVSADIDAWITAEVSDRISQKKLKIRTPALETTVRERLVRDAHGMFQWVKCQIDALCRYRNEKAIKEAIDNLPETLQETYVRILERVEKIDKDAVRNVLCWLVRGTKDLTVAELSHAIAIDNQNPDDTFDFEAVDVVPEEILRTLGGLVIVSNDQVVSLAHFSVKEFLVSEDLSKKKPEFWIGKEEVESELARSCLTYLSFQDFGTVASDVEALTERLEKYCFLSYAAQSWAELAHRSETDGHQEPELVELTMEFFSLQGDAERTNFDAWAEICNYQKVTRSLSRRNLRPLYCAAYYGLTEAAQQLLDEGNDSEIEGPLKIAASNGHASVVKLIFDFCKSPEGKDLNESVSHDGKIDQRVLNQTLYNAAAKGHSALVQVLLDEGAEIDANGGKNGTALQIASIEGRPDVVRLLVQKGASQSITSKRYGSPLCAAAEKGHQGTARILLEAGADLNDGGGWYAQPLVSAIVGQNINLVRLLMDAGADLNGQGGRHGYPIAAAAALGRDDLIEELLERGARVNDGDDKGSDALYAACLSGHLNTVNLLLERGADVNAQGGKAKNALGAASSKGHINIVRRLVTAGADVSFFDDRYGNALQDAARNGYGEVITCLAEAGVDPNAPGGDKGTALVCAASVGRSDIIEILYDVGVEAGPTSDASNALVTATLAGYEDVVRSLIKHGADLNCLSQKRLTEAVCTPLEAAAASGNVSLVKLFLELGVQPTSPSNDGQYGTALIAAVWGNPRSLDAIEMLINAGADVNQSDIGGYNTPLIRAVARQDTETIKLLLGKGADVDLIRPKMISAIQMSTIHEDPQIFDLLLEHSADINLVATDVADPVTTLGTAACFGRNDLVRRLVELGADLCITKQDTNTVQSALQFAASKNHEDVLLTLIELGADVNSQGGPRATPLQAGCRMGNLNIVRILLENGADPNQLDMEEGTSPLSSACSGPEDKINEIEEIIRLLVAHGADMNRRLTGPIRYALHMAVFNPWCDRLVNLLMELGADVNVCGGMYGTALSQAAYKGSSTLTEMLLENKADPNITGGCFNTPVQAAYRHGYYIVLNTLMEYGASVNQLGGMGKSVMGMGLGMTNFMGSLNCCPTLIHALVEYWGFDVNVEYGFYGNALTEAIMKGRVDCAETIMTAGADVNQVSPRMGSPLGAAVSRGDMDLVKKLLDAGADPNLGSFRIPNVTHAAVRAFRLDALAAVIEAGADVNPSTPGMLGTPLHIAARIGEPTFMRYLIQAGADVNPEPQGRWHTLLQAAATRMEGEKTNSINIKKRKEVFMYMLKHTTDIDARGGRFGNALGAAVMHWGITMVEKLLEKGAIANTRGVTQYNTPLQAAAVRGDMRVALKLLQSGADSNVAGGRYWTAMQAACVRGSLSMVKLLAEHDADVNIVGGRYRCALHAAAINGHEDIVRYLVCERNARWSLLDRGHIAKKQKVLDAADAMLEKVKASATSGVGVTGERKLSWRYRKQQEEELPLNVDSIPGFQSSALKKWTRWDSVAEMTLYELRKNSLVVETPGLDSSDATPRSENASLFLDLVKRSRTLPVVDHHAEEQEVLRTAKTFPAVSPEDDNETQQGWAALDWVVPDVIGPGSVW